MKAVHTTPATLVSEPVRPSLRAHLQIARVDHWVKNVFVLPGTLVALSIDPDNLTPMLPIRLALGLLAVCLVASSNYVINEVLDAPFDRNHPTKALRPVPSGQVSVPLAYVQWIVLMVAGIGLGLLVSMPFTLSLAALWLMGCFYNIPPARTKDVPYVDVLTEAVNNPIRLVAGWYLTGTLALPPTSLLISYWMVGSYFMAIKRFAEYREIGDRVRSAAYRRSFAFYTEPRLLVSVMFYGSLAMLFFGAFIMRYRLEMVLAFPLVALVMAIYLSMAFKTDSAAQHPEALYREPGLMIAVSSCTALMILLLFINVPLLHDIFTPTLPGAARLWP
jgi:4-hydroxybenzoate polyprenyltransferase